MPYDVTHKRIPMQAIFDLKGPKHALTQDDLPPFPDTPNRWTQKDGAQMCWIGPDHWLLLDGADAEDRWTAALCPETCPPEISIVRISDTMAMFQITGTDAPEVLSIGCPLDLHDSVFPADAVSFTEMYGLRALVMRCKGGFVCGVEQSFAQMLTDYLSASTR